MRYLINLFCFQGKFNLQHFFTMGRISTLSYGFQYKILLPVSNSVLAPLLPGTLFPEDKKGRNGQANSICYSWFSLFCSCVFPKVIIFFIRNVFSNEVNKISHKKCEIRALNFSFQVNLVCQLLDHKK